MEKTAVEAYRQNSDEARERLILENLAFVSRVLSSFGVVYTDPQMRETLNSAGVVGLIEAVNSFVPTEGVAFESFAYPRVRGAIIDELRRQTPVSQRVFANLKLIRRTCELLSKPNTPEDIAETSGLKLDEVAEGLEAMRFMNPNEWDDISPVATSWRDQARPEDSVDEEETREQLASAITRLPERERLVITLYYYEEMNLAEIGATLDLSISRVSRILTSARFRIKEEMQCKST